MNTRLQVLEYSSPKIQGNVILGVKIVGVESSNGYTYPVPVLKAAMPLYENAPVFVEHPNGAEKRRGSRQLVDHFGTLQNIRQKHNGKGLYGDLHVKASHPMAEAILEEAAGAARFGLSHNAIVGMNEAQTEVTEIFEVNSVDLTDKPATTANLFESTEPKTTAELEARIAVLEEAATVKPTITKRLTALESIEEEDRESVLVIGNTHDDFLGVLHGFPITNKKGT